MGLSGGVVVSSSFPHLNMRVDWLSPLSPLICRRMFYCFLHTYMPLSFLTCFDGYWNPLSSFAQCAGQKGNSAAADVPQDFPSALSNRTPVLKWLFYPRMQGRLYTQHCFSSSYKVELPCTIKSFFCASKQKKVDQDRYSSLLHTHTLLPRGARAAEQERGTGCWGKNASFYVTRGRRCKIHDWIFFFFPFSLLAKVMFLQKKCEQFSSLV